MFLESCRPLWLSLCGIRGWCVLPVESHGKFVCAPDKTSREDKAIVRRACLERVGARPGSKVDQRATSFGSTQMVFEWVLEEIYIFLDFGQTLALIAMIGEVSW